jgi:elongation factor G
VPRQYIPSVEEGVRMGLAVGPLGFPVTGVSVKLTDGKYHSVDSSDMAFQTAGRQAIQEALPACAPVLLEPVMAVRIHVPTAFTSKVNAVVMSRRGALLGFDTRPDWSGWDTVAASIPQAEMDDLIIELRSLTLGAASFDASFDHRSEVSGKPADQIIKARKSQLDASPRAA